MATARQHRNALKDELIVDALAQDYRQIERIERLAEILHRLKAISILPAAQDLLGEAAVLAGEMLADERGDIDRHLASAAIEQAQRRLAAKAGA
jgi:hypothetical protein